VGAAGRRCTKFDAPRRAFAPYRLAPNRLGNTVTM
jgi:hypothetical protein